MIGIISALGASFSWTYACFLWRKQAQFFSSRELNLIKNFIAFVIFIPIIFTINYQYYYKEIFILMISGVIGIGIGDSLYITSLKLIGTRKTLTVEALSPIFSSILGSILIKEILPIKTWFGILIVSISLIGVATEKSIILDNKKSVNVNKLGFLYALLSVFCAVIAAVLSRIVLINSNLNTLQTTEIRLLSSLIFLLFALKFKFIKSINNLSFKNKKSLVYATLLGTNLGIVLQQNVFQLLPIGLGWTLLSTSPVFSLFFAKAEGDRFTLRSLFFTATIIIGITIMFI